MSSQAPLIFALVAAFLLVGCARPSTQWWRVGNCLVVYEQTGDEKQLIAVGQNCEIKRDVITAQGEMK